MINHMDMFIDCGEHSHIFQIQHYFRYLHASSHLDLFDALCNRHLIVRNVRVCYAERQLVQFLAQVAGRILLSDKYSVYQLLFQPCSPMKVVNYKEFPWQAEKQSKIHFCKNVFKSLVANERITRNLYINISNENNVMLIPICKSGI